MNTIQPALSEPMPRYWAAAAALTVYALAMLVSGNLGWQHIGLAAMVWACLAPEATARRFIREWWPIILFWLGYDMMRIYMPFLYGRVAVASPFEWERALFRARDGLIWPFHLTRWLDQSGGGLLPRALHVYSILIYLSHLFVFPVSAFIIWITGRERLFRRLLWSFTALHILGLAIYIGYPAAPPWWVYENGFAKPSAVHHMPMSYGQGSTLGTLFLLSANKFAAIPSLHGAYPILLTLVLALEGVKGRWIVIGIIYAFSMWFACVFLNQHYLVDLLIGAALIPAALPFATDRYAVKPGR